MADPNEVGMDRSMYQGMEADDMSPVAKPMITPPEHPTTKFIRDLHRHLRMGFPPQDFSAATPPNAAVLPANLVELPDVNVAAAHREMPGPGYVEGQLHLNQDLAPQVTPGGARPFAPGEWIDNPGGGWSSEITVTPQLPDGSFTNIPSLWVMPDGRPYVAQNEDEALALAQSSGLIFPTYRTQEEAEKAANAREENWAAYKDDPSKAKEVSPLWEAPMVPPAEGENALGLLLQQSLKALLSPQGLLQGIPGLATAPSYPEGTILPQKTPLGTADNPLLQPGPEGSVVGSRPIPGTLDRNRFWNPNEIAPYNPPGGKDDRKQET